MLDDSVFMRLNVCEVLKAKAFSDVLNFQMAGDKGDPGPCSGERVKP